MGKPKVQKRFIHNETFYLPDQVAWKIIDDWLYNCGFRPYDYWGEQIYKCGDGFFAAAKNVKIFYQQGNLHMEYWLRAAGGKEMDLEGTYGWAVKNNARQQIEDLLQFLRAAQQPYLGQGQQAYSVQGQQPYPVQGQQAYPVQGQQPYPAQGQMMQNGQSYEMPNYYNDSAMKIATVISIVMLILIILLSLGGMVVGYFGIIASIVGIRQSLIAMRSKKKTAYIVFAVNVIECIWMVIGFVMAIASAVS